MFHSIVECHNMGYNGHRINLYGVFMIIMGNLHAGDRGTLSPSKPGIYETYIYPSLILCHLVSRARSANPGRVGSLIPKMILGKG